jgi:hypothetical protein
MVKCCHHRSRNLNVALKEQAISIRKDQGMADLNCECGACGFDLNFTKPQLSLFCGCKDCRQALEWGATKGGKNPSALPELIYMRSDISAITGKSFMKAFQLRQDAKSTRLYCVLCFSVIGVDYPGYRDNVFMFFKNHCRTSCDLSQSPAAAIYLNDLPDLSKAEVPIDVPVFHSFRFQQEQSRFRKINGITDTFKKPASVPAGQSLRDIIKTLGPVEILNLRQGKSLI